MSERLKPIRFKKGNLVAICAKAEPVAVVATLHGGDETARCRVNMLFLLRDKGVTLYKVDERRPKLALGSKNGLLLESEVTIRSPSILGNVVARMGLSYEGAKIVSKRVST